VGPLRQKDVRKLLSALPELYAATDRNTFKARVIRLTSGLIRSEITGYNELDRGVITGVMEPFDGDQTGAWEIFSRYASEHPVIRHHEATGTSSATKISDFLSRRQFHDLGLYQEFFGPLRVEHQIAVSFLATPHVRIGIAFNRCRPDFSERERLLLELLRPHAAQAYRNADFLASSFDAVMKGAGRCATVVVDTNRRILLSTEQAARCLSEYFRSSGIGHLPENLDRWVQHWQQALSQDWEIPFPLRPLLVERAQWTLQIRLTPVPTREIWVLSFEELRQGGCAEPLPFLTDRENEVLHWVAQGKTNRDIGMILSISALTVRKHLERIFEKLGVENRTAASLRALDAKSFSDSPK
jgi:DNA-binding CsgD family transcriptional regulator